MTFTILTLNLHSCQEFKDKGDTIAEQLRKHGPPFDQIASAIVSLDVDVVCLQEAGETRTDPLMSPDGQAH